MARLLTELGREGLGRRHHLKTVVIEQAIKGVKTPKGVEIMAATFFAVALALVVLFVLIGIPVIEGALAHLSSREVYEVDAEQYMTARVQRHYTPTAFLMMDFVRIEKAEATQREFAERYTRGDIEVIGPLFAVPANSNSEAVANNG
jgi:hypothetical protein